MSHYLIFGGASGIGAEVASKLVDENHQLTIFDIKKPDAKHAGNDYFFVDLSKPEEVEKTLKELPDDLALDGIIYSAGIREICSLSDLTYKEWKKVFSVNVDSFFIAVQSLQGRLKSGASVVNISSVSGVLGEPDRSAYVSSKHALIGLTKCLAVELAHKKIRVNSVAPGVIRTSLTEQYYSDDALMRKINNNHILKRTGTVAEVAEAVLFLLSSKSSFTTGSTLFVDGGWSAFKDI